MLLQHTTLLSRNPDVGPWAGTGSSRVVYIPIRVACGLFITLSRGITVVKIVLAIYMTKDSPSSRNSARVCVSESVFGRRAPFSFPSFLRGACHPPPHFAIVINDNDSGTSFYYSRGITSEMQNGLVQGGI